MNIPITPSHLEVQWVYIFKNEMWRRLGIKYVRQQYNP